MLLIKAFRVLLPAGFMAVISSASVSSLSALLAAEEGELVAHSDYYCHCNTLY